ncbi:DUF5682 family protein [Hymenobacter cellulosilyticus]|uniref:DUF5682 family protein n=1 Tax=Hymenobacter cellulosilyticus TaxID=2932248 RepID=A0A8T9Q3B5_9BACT|nr:DUF5682 family protein [Hymenobacter cellulosilyticus]UOQ70941.1 DUF5682 family protein [Hymenobacter cellulosilyticus]
MLLIHHRPLFDLLDDWLSGLDETVFQEVVPLLRRSFADFTQPERQQVLALAGGTAARPTETVADIDLERGLHSLAGLRELLGMVG